MDKKDKLKYIEMKTKEIFIDKGVLNKNLFDEPEFLYKYMKINENTLDSLINDYVWCGRASNLNDPFECRIKNDEEEKDILIRYADEVNKKYNLDLANEKIKITYEYLREKAVNNALDGWSNISNSAYLTSFSETYDNILMWSHYSNCHMGICVEYSFDNINKAASNALFPVVYDEYIPRVRDYLENKKLIVVKQITTKLDGWEYENEWRILNPYQKNIYEIVYGEDNNILGFKVSLKANRIFLGCKISSDNEKAIREIALRKDIEVIKLSISNTKYELVVK